MSAPTISMDALRTLFDYLAVRDEGLPPCDVIIGFGVFDLKVPRHCVSLFDQKRAPRIVFTGGFGSGSGDLKEPEAVVFRKVALEMGVPEANILHETDSRFTGENVEFSKRLLEENGVRIRNAILVAQPHRQRRVALTFQKYFAGLPFFNSPPPATLEEEIGLFDGPARFHEHLAGEARRLQDYADKGFIVRERVPEAVLQAARLV